MAQSVVPDTNKLIHTIVLDSSPLLLNSPSISTLLARSHALYTTPSVLAEIKDADARQRIEILCKPFITIRLPKLESIKHVKDFARRTGDAAVLSVVDYDILALAYDLECERNKGDWRLRNVPGQKKLNGKPPLQEMSQTSDQSAIDANPDDDSKGRTNGIDEGLEALDLSDANQVSPLVGDERSLISSESLNAESTPSVVEAITESESGSDSEGWITPSNIKKRQAEEESKDNATREPEKVLQVATMTGDFAMQNVLLQMNLNLVSTKSCKRVTVLKQMILRCHGCFATTKDMSKQFCQRCGQPTLTRVSCTTTDKGETRLHLKANMQWNNRGNVFSIPKPTSGTSNQKWQGPRFGGGQEGWGRHLILAEDQKEYTREVAQRGRAHKAQDLMDPDYLPQILTGDRSKNTGKVKVGGGRNINSRKR